MQPRNTHAVTNRMTAGGAGRCLQSIEGEAWSDAMAEYVSFACSVRSRAHVVRADGSWMKHKDATVPDYVLGQEGHKRPCWNSESPIFYLGVRFLVMYVLRLALEGIQCQDCEPTALFDAD